MKIKIYKICLNDSHRLYMNDSKRDYIIADRKVTNYKADRFKFKVFNMISDWQKEMVEPDIIDGVEYKIVIKEKDKEDTFVFKNRFPQDIYRLENLFDEVLEAICYVK